MAGNELEYQFYKKIVFDNVKTALGLGECVGFYTGAAPMQTKTWEYFMSLDIKILDIYGMSETSGPHTLVTNESLAGKMAADKKNGYSSCGKVLCDSFKSKLVSPGNEGITEEKELCMWGRHIMMGYKDRQDATTKEMSSDGWMKSGDLAKIDDDGFVSIVGRDKDLIITAGGENIPPAPIQDAVKKELPLVSQSLLLGDQQRFISLFLTLTTEVDLDTMEPTDKLTVAAKDWCKSKGSSAETVQDVLEGPDRCVMAALQEGIDKVNKEATSNAQKIQKWMVIPKDFSLPGGELGPTMKVKRGEVTKKYKNCIDKIYSLAPGRA
jgi:long-chain-fatty-acid--CoA ligase ACSBG